MGASRASRGELMSKTYQYSGLTKELHSRLVSEHAALKEAHPKDYKQFFQDVKQCDELQARLSSDSVRKWKNYARNTLTT